MLQIECRNLDPPTYILCVYKTLIVISAIIPHPFRRNNEVKLLLRVFMFIFLALFTILAQSPSSTFLFDHVFRRRRSAIIARPLGQPKTATRRSISPFQSFFRHFHRDSFTQSHWTQILSNSFPTFSGITWSPLGKQMTTHVSHSTSILLPPLNSVQSVHSIAPDHRGS